MSISVANYAAVPNGKVITDISISAGSNQLASTAQMILTTADEGKTVYIEGAALAGAVYKGVIEGVSASIATLSHYTALAVTNARAAYGKDNTAAIQAAANDAEDDTLVFDKGPFVDGYGRLGYMHEALDFSDFRSIKLQGSGPAQSGTMLIPCAVNTVAYDFSGVCAAIIEGLTIGQRFNPCVPRVGLLHAPTQWHPGMDFVHYRDVQVTGRYYFFTLYNFGAGAGQMDKVAFWNFGNWGDGWIRGAAYFGLDNPYGMQSAFAQLRTEGGVGAWSLNSFEAHDSSGGATNSRALLLRGASELHFDTPILQSSSICVEIQDAQTQSGAVANRRNRWTLPRFEAEKGMPTPVNAMRLTGNLYNSTIERHMSGYTGTFASGSGQFIGCEIT